MNIYNETFEDVFYSFRKHLLILQTKQLINWLRNNEQINDNDNNH